MEKEKTKNPHIQIYHRLRQLFPELPTKYIDSAIYKAKQYPADEIGEINPAYTSVIGMLKYAPQLNIDKDIASAYVIGRRALGFKEDMPENYEKLLKDKTYLEFALKGLFRTASSPYLKAISLRLTGLDLT